ncbi:Uncharacterised protein [Mycobacteroides abscessus]|nr:Uncharacterised protein [Mycobacteroides abscessus]
MRRRNGRGDCRRVSLYHDVGDQPVGAERSGHRHVQFCGLGAHPVQQQTGGEEPRRHHNVRGAAGP